MCSLRIICFLLPIIIYGISTVFASVYPNFHAEWEFKSLDNKKDWYETASFYQIYPRSFKDTDGDGIGDLKGITKELPYLKEIGVTAAWLSPIFKSPMKDFGYDISDFYSIQPEYGTMEDFENLMARAKELNMKILLDFVPNHSSDQNEWFKKSVGREKGFENFYVWHPGYVDPNDPNKRLPPSNWVSVFRGSAWQWNEERKEFYFHQFLAAQPDLNYRDSNVVAEMKNVLKFWLDKGVDGFRIDAVPHLFEIAPDKDGNYKDEPRNPEVTDPDDYGYLKHIYTVDQDETLDMLYQWREVLDNYKNDHNTDTIVLLAETYSPLDVVMKYYGDGKGREGAHLPFNFLIIEQLNNGSNANDFSKIIHKWLDKMPKGRTANWVSGNHDKPRVATRMNTQRIDLMNFVIMTLPGASVHYNGDEIGMTNVWISWKDTVDPAACNSNPDIYELFSRDPQRTPFHWNDEKNAGFSTADKTWLPVAENYKEVNVKVERGIPKSPLNVFKNLQNLRTKKTIQEGSTTVKALNDDVLAILRKLEKQSTYITLANIGSDTQKVDLTDLDNLPDELVYEVISSHTTHRVGDIVLTKDIELMPFEAVVLKTNEHLRSILGFYYYQRQ